MSPSSEETRTQRSPERRARRAMRTLNHLHQGRPDESAIFDRLEGMVRERTSRRMSVTPDRVALLDREIERLSLEHETLHTAQLAEASRQVETHSRQILFLVTVLGILAAGTTAVAFQGPYR